MKNLNRRSFVIGIGTIGLGALALTACGSSSSSYGGAGNGGQSGNGNCGDGGSSVYTNPSHAHTTINLTAQEIAGATPGTYVLLGGNHDHTFDLTANDFTTISNGAKVQKTDLEGHGHILELSC